MADINLDLIPDADFEALKANDLDSLSDATLDYLRGKGSSVDAFTSNFQRGFTSTLRGLGVPFEGEQEDLDSERKARMLAETNPVAAIAGGFSGSILEPVTLPFMFLKPLKIGGAIATGALRGSVSGGVYGAVEPVYEQLNDSRMMNIGVGIGLGGVIGAAAGKIASKFGFDPKSPTLKDDIAKAPDDVQARMENELEDVVDAATPPKETGGVVKGFDGRVTEADEVNIDLGGETRWNPELKSMEKVEVASPSMDFAVPPVIKGQVKVAKTTAQGLDDIDEALWHIGGPNATKADIALTHLAEKTGASHKELKLMAQTSRKELARRSAAASQEGKLDFGGKPTSMATMLRNRVDPPRQIITPIQPKRINLKDGLDMNDRELLKKAGVFMRTNKAGNITFHDMLNGHKFMPGNELKTRMNAVGIDLDIPQFKQQQKAGQAVKEAAPEIKAEVEAKQTQEAFTRPSAEAPQATPKVDPLDVAPDDIGIPKPNRSVGSAGVDPKTYLGPEMMPNTSKSVRKGGVASERVLLKMLENDDPRVALPKDQDKVVKGLGNFRAAKRDGAEALRDILKEHGNMAEFIISRKGGEQLLTRGETVAMRWFHADAMQHRAKALNTLKDIVNGGGGLDTPEVAKLADDLVYYTGIDMFMRNEGTKLSRAFNARRILKQTIEKGQTPQTKMMRGLFPGMSCK